MALVGSQRKDAGSGLDAEAVLAALRAFMAGDYSVRLPTNWPGIDGEIASTINEFISARTAVTGQFIDTFNRVGEDGLLDSHFDTSKLEGRLVEVGESLNTMLGNLLAPLNEMMSITSAVARGDLSQRVPLTANGKKKEGQLLVWAEMMNQMMGVLSTFASEVSRLAHEVGAEGKLGGQAVVPGVTGVWKEVTDGVNELAANRTNQLRAIGEVAARVIAGDFSEKITVNAKGEVAEIREKINEMVRNLEYTTQRNSEQDWLKTNYAKLSRDLQGLRDLTVAATVMLSEISPLIGAIRGVFYILDASEGGGPQLKLLATYAYQGRTDTTRVWKLGEGLVGQCAVDKKPLHVMDIPADYVDVASGLGHAKPLELLLIPVLYEGHVKGIIELASFRPFTPVERTFLDQASDSFGTVLNTIQIDMHTEELLRQSQSMTEELQIQQEELRATNQELEEKAELLEDQKRVVEEKNREVEVAKNAIEEKAEQLALSSKYKSEFLSNMSHELRTPLNSLLILAEHLAENRTGHLDEREVEFAKLIHVSGGDLLSLINEILDLSKIESGTVSLDLSHIDVDKVCDQMEKTFRHMAEDRGLDFAIVISEDINFPIVSDEMRLMQVLKNLLSNSFKFTSQGKVSLHVSKAESGWSEDSKVLHASEGVLAFTVEDTGIGISEEKQKIVFEAFQQGDGSTARKYGGTGLGLSISREIARLLGGELRLEKSALEEGSTFVFYLPSDVSQDQNGTRHPARKGPVLPQRRPKEDSRPRAIGRSGVTTKDSAISDDRESIESSDRVLLIIEDDPIFAKILLDLARERGFKGVVAMRGAEVLPLARRFALDAITLDIHIPDVDGWAILEMFKRDPNLRHIPIDVITVEKDAERALSHGAFHFISKPTSRAELDAAFESMSDFLDRPLKNLLLATSDSNDMQEINDLLRGEDLRIHHVEDGQSAEQLLGMHDFDCIVVGTQLKDLRGIEFVELLQKNRLIGSIPVVMFNHEPFSDNDRSILRKISESGIIQDVGTLERLLDQTALFLHRVISQLPDEKRDLIERNQRMSDSLTGKKVLIVDDDPRNIIALTAALEIRGARIQSAGDGLEALEALNVTPDIAIVLMDIMMPGLDGYDTMREIRKHGRFKSLPIIALTAKAMVGDREKCIKAGASDYLSKPVAIEQLVSLMQVWLSKQ